MGVVLVAFACGFVIASFIFGVALSTARQRVRELEEVLMQLGGSLDRAMKIYRGGK